MFGMLWINVYDSVFQAWAVYHIPGYFEIAAGWFFNTDETISYVF
jgi:hypothetical protein